MIKLYTILNLQNSKSDRQNITISKTIHIKYYLDISTKYYVHTDIPYYTRFKMRWNR